jgi:hypothetical protein
MNTDLCFLGCVWVYRIYKPNMDEDHSGDADYCNKTVYLFAFWCQSYKTFSSVCKEKLLTIKNSTSS